LRVRFEDITRGTMDEEYDVIVLGTGLKVSEALVGHASWNRSG